MWNDPRINGLARVLGSQPPIDRQRDAALSEAAVLLVLRPAGNELELLLIERAEKEGDPWSGHMALPGGRREVEDPDLLATAIRETREETGIVVPKNAVLGPLDEVRPGARRRFSIVVAPFVAVVPPHTIAVPEPSEVETAIWVPLHDMASEDAVDEILIELDEGSRAFPALNYQEYVIWGLTHRILEGFIALSREAGLV